MDSIWKQKGATLSDKSARQEFGLTQQEIYEAMRAGKLQFQQNSMHGNPWFRLLRHEVEALGRQEHKQGEEYRQADTGGGLARTLAGVETRVCQRLLPGYSSR
jgi:hypothetical protein